MGWLEGWQYRKSHVIEGSPAGAVADYQIRIVAHYGSGEDSGEDVYLNGHARADFGDVRFTSSDGTTLLDYWIEELVEGDYAIFWVKVDSIPASPDSKTIYIYYGKSDATTASNGDNTFVLFDDFSTDTLSEYVLIDDCWYISDGLLKRDSSAPGGGFISKSISLSREYAVRARIYIGSLDAGVGFIWGTAGGGEGSVSGYIANYYYTSTYSRLRRYDSGSQTNLASLPTQKNVWRILEVRVTSDKVIVVRDGVEDASVTDTTYSTLNGVGFREKASSIDAVDWWVLRKYINPEPSHGAWGYEETPPLPPAEVKPVYYISYSMFEQIINMIYTVVVMTVIFMILLVIGYKP